jgi:hypothetical protein
MSLTVVPASVTPDTPIPSGLQQLINTVAAYLTVAGYESVEGLVISSTEPGPDQRDRVWMRTDPGSGAPLSFLTYNAGSWQSLPSTMAYGPTEDRPTAPADGEQFFDTDLNIAIVYERSSWRTLSGTPGDIKHVRATSLAVALTNNPGWKEFVEGRGRVLGGAGAGDGLTARAHLDTAGTEDHTLVEDELPVITPTIDVVISSNYSSTSGDNFEGAPGSERGTKTLTAESFGSGDSHNNMQPTVFVWMLEKE